MTRLRALLPVLAALVLAGAGALTGSGCGSAASTIDPVAKAADVTSREGGAQIEFTARVSGEGLSTPLTMKGQGEFNFSGEEGRLALALEDLPGELSSRLHSGTLSMTELYKGGVGYVRSPLFDGKLPHGARWLKIDLKQVLEAEGLSPSSLTSGGVNPSQYLQYLKGVGVSLSSAGHETVRGAQTTRYSGTFDVIEASEHTPGANPALVRRTFEKLLPSAADRNVPMSVWIDAHQHVRRISMAIEMQSGGHGAKFELTMEFSGFGPTSTVHVPSDSETFDVTKSTLEATTSS